MTFVKKKIEWLKITKFVKKIDFENDKLKNFKHVNISIKNSNHVTI